MGEDWAEGRGAGCLYEGDIRPSWRNGEQILEPGGVSGLACHCELTRNAKQLVGGGGAGAGLT